MPYQLGKKIGQGGMGCVYQATDTNTRQTVAIKMMSNQMTFDPRYRQLFQDEVNALRRMNNSSVVKIVGSPYYDQAGNLYLPMEYINGQTISEHVRVNGSMSTHKAGNMMCKILDAIQYVHNQNIIHRDIKPSNIMIRQNGDICVIDFGIAKDAKVGGTGKTVGQIIGTDGYMSPEQASGLNIDKRTDIYSLGCVLYYLLTGRHAIPSGQDGQQTIANIINLKPKMPSEINQGITGALDAVFSKAVDKNMTMRYQSAAEFKQAIVQALQTPSHLTPCVTIGKHRDNDIVIDNLFVSQHHLNIQGLTEISTGTRDKDYSLEITDHSINGTTVDGERLQNNTLHVPYTNSGNLPQVLLPGEPEIALDWTVVLQKLKTKGWDPIQLDPPPPPPPPRHWLLRITSLLIPLVGGILWAVYCDEHPAKASLAAKFGGIGLVIYLLIALLIN